MSFINKNVNTYLKAYLKKMEFDTEDFQKVDSMTLSAFDLAGNFISNSLSDLKNFGNLKKLHISKYILNEENLEILRNLKNVEDYIFQKCDFKEKLTLNYGDLLLSDCQKVYNVFDNKFKNVFLESIDLKDANISCENLTLSFCENIDKSQISSGKVEFKNTELSQENIDFIKRLAENVKNVIIYTDDDVKDEFENISNIEILERIKGENIG